MSRAEQYYALFAEEGGENEIAFLYLGKNEHGTVLGLAVYTSPDGEAQREHLNAYEGVVVEPISPEDLLDAMNHGLPNSVFLDGKKFAGSVFKGRLKTELGLPIKHPRSI